jgi:two-component system, NarL family, sensor histidine kinase UhpB
MPKLLLVLTAMIVINVVHGQNFNTDSLLLELKTAKEDTNKVTLFRNIGVSLAHQDPQTAIEYWKQGVILAKKLNYDMGLARSYINIGTGYAFMGKYDSSIVYSDTAIIYCHKINDVNRLALIYLNQGDAYRNLQDFKRALLYCDTALSYAEKTGSTDRLARIYDIISDVYAAQKQFPSSITYLDKALNLYRKDENALMVGQVYSDFADIYKQMNQHDKAIGFYKMAIQIADSVQDLKNLSTYYGDLTDLYINQGKYKEAEGTALKSVQYARQQENNLQLATSYNHLSNLYLKQKKYGQAVETGNQAYQLAVAEDNLLWQKESSTLLSQAYSGINDYQNAFRFLSISKKLNDTILRQQFGEETAGLQTRFQVKEKDKEILLLNKDKELREARLKQQQFYLITSIAIAILALLGIWLLVNRNKLRQRMKELELRNRIATDLHDEVGSSLSSIHVMSNMATRQQERDQKLNDTLVKISSNAQDTMERMSDIVWAIHPANDTLEQLIVRMKEFAADILEPLGINYSFIIQEDLTSAKLTVNQRRDLYLVFKEAINNAAKYSNCKHIKIELAQRDGKLILQISDDGKGFEEATVVHGNGLNNMQQRAKSIGGSLSIDSKPSQGTTVSLTMKA